MLAPSVPVSDDSKEKGQSRSPITLVDLPCELLINIFILLPPPDIVILGKCCRILHQISDERQLWSIILKNASMENRIFPLTYPIETMLTEDLKKASTHSWKLRHQIWNQETRLQPIRVQTLPPRLDITLNSMELIPGGRFLLATDMMHRLFLWDLGYGPNALVSQEPLAMKQFSESEELDDMWFLIHPTFGGESTVCCAVFTESEEISSGQIHIIEIYPTSNHSKFNTLGVRDLTEEDQESLYCYNMTGDLFGYHANEQLVIWDFRNNTEYRTACEEESEMMLLFNGVVLLLSPNGYSIFSMPVFASTNSAARGIELITSASFLLKACKFHLPLSWYIEARDPASTDWQKIHVDAVVEHYDESREIHRYTLSTSMTEAGSLSVTFMYTGETNKMRETKDHEIIFYTMPGDKHGLVWVGGRFVGLDVIRGDLGWETKENEVDLDKNWSFSCCSFAGRACVLASSGEIVVMDFTQ